MFILLKEVYTVKNVSQMMNAYLCLDKTGLDLSHFILPLPGYDPVTEEPIITVSPRLAGSPTSPIPAGTTPMPEAPSMFSTSMAPPRERGFLGLVTLPPDAAFTTHEFDVDDFISETHSQVESVPRGDTLYREMLPPLPTMRSSPSYLDVAEEEDSSRGLPSGEKPTAATAEEDGSSGSPDSESKSGERETGKESSSRHHDLGKPAIVYKEDKEGSADSDVSKDVPKTEVETSGVTTEVVVIAESTTRVPGLSEEAAEVKEPKAEVNSETLTPSTVPHTVDKPLDNQDVAIPTKFPFHLLIVSAAETNKSGEPNAFSYAFLIRDTFFIA